VSHVKPAHSLVKYKSTHSTKTLHIVQTKIWQITLFQNLILFTNHYGNLEEMLEMASFLKYVGLYLTREWDRFYVGHLYNYGDQLKGDDKISACIRLR
jgi:hypothetical protein